MDTEGVIRLDVDVVLVDSVGGMRAQQLGIVTRPAYRYFVELDHGVAQAWLAVQVRKQPPEKPVRRNESRLKMNKDRAAGMEPLTHVTLAFD